MPVFFLNRPDAETSKSGCLYRRLFLTLSCLKILSLFIIVANLFALFTRFHLLYSRKSPLSKSLPLRPVFYENRRLFC
ncbi:unnamed protein product [Meloidogyne enterolobii]|uniref:Uncharacterized protein n=1 Tax=Meloidogyne enterolobii TaxID=390850 RepID=A0ACB1AB75_MELEN